jgi:hypothetical protein
MKKIVIGIGALCALVFAATAGAIAEKVLKLGVGDVVFVKGSSLSCSVANPYHQMVCFKHNRSGHPVPRSYGTTTSDRFAGVVRFNKHGKPVVIVRKDNR